MAEEYKSVSITIEPGNLQTNELGWFTLAWPGHEGERIQSAYKQVEYILVQAKEFVDTWLEDGYITVNAEKSGETRSHEPLS
jgi:hypothetical protein